MDPLSNHIATVVEYLVEYQKIQALEEKRQYFHHFAMYMVAQCWKKMRQRIIHSSSLAYIYHLSRVTEERLRRAFTFYISSGEAEQLPKRDDSVLGRLLVGMHDQGQIENIIMRRCGRSELSSEKLLHLMAAFKRTTEETKSSAGVLREDGMGAYNGLTCWEFHRLLLATILAYGKALDELHNIDEEIHPDARLRRRDKYALGAAELESLQRRHAEYIQQAWVCAVVLWRISSSAALRHHLTVLRGIAALNLPHHNMVNLAWYRSYTGFPRITCPDIVPGERSGQNNIDRVEEDHEFQRIEDGKDEPAEVYLNWIRLLVAYWEALETVSSGIRNSTARTLKVSLIVLNSPDVRMDLHVEPWRTTVEDLLASVPPRPSTYTDIPKAEAVIDTIAQYIDRKKEVMRRDSIFYAFRDDPKPVKFFGDVHSEAALASLQRYICGLSEPQTEGVKALIQVIFT